MRPKPICRKKKEGRPIKMGSNTKDDRDKDRKTEIQEGKDNNSSGPSMGLMCEDSVQSPIINPIG